MIMHNQVVHMVALGLVEAIAYMDQATLRHRANIVLAAMGVQGSVEDMIIANRWHSDHTKDLFPPLEDYQNSSEA